MRPASEPSLISVGDYLTGELASEVKHEYLGGVIYAMAGASNVHNLIAGNLFGLLHGHLKSGPCRPYNSDTKIRIRLSTETRFYYPDLSVVRRPNAPDESFQDQPLVVAVVMSAATRRVDEGEKREAYLQIASLSAYLLLEQDRPSVVAYRRTDTGFTRELSSQLDATLALPEIQTELALRDIYDGVSFLWAG